MNSFTIAALLAILGTAMYTGVMITIGLGFGRYWRSLDPVDFMAWFAKNFNFLLPTIATTLPFSLIGLIWSLTLARNDLTTRLYWAGALALVIITLIQTVVYHVPTNATFQKQTLSSSAARTKLSQWLLSHWVRVALALIASLLSVIALQLSV